jgi:hypothetical protein
MHLGWVALLLFPLMVPKLRPTYPAEEEADLVVVLVVPCRHLSAKYHKFLFPVLLWCGRS